MSKTGSRRITTQIWIKGSRNSIQWKFYEMHVLFV